MSESKKFALTFFDEIVNNYMLNDLKRLTKEIVPIPNKGGNCNFPIALYVLCCMEYLGYLTSIHEVKEDQPGYSKDRILLYIEVFFDETSSKSIMAHKDKFVDIFRNGLSHEFFAKAAGVSRKGFELLTVNSGMLILDADKLAEAFIESTKKLREYIEIDKYGINQSIMDRYKKKEQKNQKFLISDTPVGKMISGATLSRIAKDLIDNPLKTSSEINIEDFE